MTHITYGMGKGIVCGTLASSLVLFGALLIAGAGEALEWEVLVPLVLVVGLVLKFTCLLVALSATVVGLPVVWLLDRLHCTNALSIGLAGAVLGGAMFLLPTLDDTGPIDPELTAFILAAAAGGGATGWSWGTVQQRMRRAGGDLQHPNRIEDQRILR